jgi:hypothetical protein
MFNWRLLRQSTQIHFGILIFEDRKVIALNNLPTLSKNAMC